MARQVEIKRIKIQGFKSLKDIDFEMRPLNVLIGPNNGGKTNFLDFFEFLSEAAHEELQNAIARRGGFYSLLFANAKKEEIFCDIHFFLDFPILEKSSEEHSYMVGLSEEFLETKIKKEILDKKDLRIRKKPRKQSDLLLPLLSGQKTFPTEYEPLKEGELAIAQMPTDWPEHLLREFMKSWAMYEFLTTKDSPLRREQSLKAGVRISPNGDNLAAVLHNIREQGEYRDAYNEILKTLKVAFPAFKDLHFPSGGGEGKIVIKWDEGFRRDFSSAVLSDGTLKFLCLVTLLLSPWPPDLICIDEPEIGLHPQLIGLVAELLMAASERTQLIVATHSPQLIKKLKPEDVVVVEKKDGATELKRLPPEELESWLKDFTLDELWLTGVIGGR